MIRRAATILLLISFLLLSMGTIELLHAMHEHEEHGSHDCQVCYFLSTVATALVAFVLVLFCLGDLTPRLFASHEVPLLQQNRANPAAPRAPPVD